MATTDNDTGVTGGGGKWEVGGTVFLPEGQWPTVKIYALPGIDIADVCGRTPAEARNNAWLMVGAPRMQAAIKQMLYVINGPYDARGPNTYTDARDELHDALAATKPPEEVSRT